MASTDAAPGESLSIYRDWPALSEPERRAPGPAGSGGEVVYLWPGVEPDTEPAPDAPPEADYLTALVGLVDELTQRLVASERARVRAEVERDAARARASQQRARADELARQLQAYCQSLVRLNCALEDTGEVGRQTRQRLDALQAAVAQVAQSPLALPIRARLLVLAESR